METTRDLGCADLWAKSLEQSLARRGRPRRASVELYRLKPERDLSTPRPLRESSAYWHIRRTAVERAEMPLSAAGGGAAMALLAATTLPSVLGGRAIAATVHAQTVKPARPAGKLTGAIARALTVSSHRSNPVLAPAERRVALAKTAAAAPARATPAPGRPIPAKAPPAPGRAKLATASPTTVRAVRAAFSKAPARGSDASTSLAPPQSGGASITGPPRPATAATRAPARPAAHQPARHRRVHAASPPAPHRPAPALIGVKALQQKLGVGMDGDFGPATRAAVEAFQRAHGLTPNGIVGAATRAALGLAPGPVLSEVPSAASPVGQTSRGGAGSPSASWDPPSGAAAKIAAMVAAGTQIATRPYVYGGGHGSFTSSGYDCSGSVSYVLHAAGLLSSPLDSTGFESYGAAGPGRYVTIYANAGHALMTIAGRRYDTIALAETGTRWSSTLGATGGYVIRHPVGM